MPSRLEIERSASALLKEAGVEDQFPVPLEKIAAFLGYESIGFGPEPNNAETANISGLIDYSNKKIYVNTSQSLSRQRFTLAHEIGHAYLHKEGNEGIVDLRSNIDNPQTEKEREANQFAAALLMPKKEFIRQWVQWKGDTEMLSKLFGASKDAVKIRKENTVDVSV